LKNLKFQLILTLPIILNKYLINEFNKKDINISIIKYLIEHGIDINKEDMLSEILLFKACKNGNEVII